MARPSAPSTPGHAPPSSSSFSRRTLPANVCHGMLGRYALYGELAHGGMAAVHLGRLLGPVGFSRTVAIKRLHPHFAADPDFVSMFLDEARLAARIRHPNVVQTLDVVAQESELFLVMEYVHGESLWALSRVLRKTEQRPPLGVAIGIMVGVLSGLHAAHEATDEHGVPLQIVHRDMSPQNVLVCVDGLARVLDFGIAKASVRVQSTRDGQLKGKVSYVAPEQLQAKPVDRRTDVYSAALTFWELLTSKRAFAVESEWEAIHLILEGKVAPPSSEDPTIPEAIDAIVAKGLSRNPNDRFSTAREMAEALENVIAPASPRRVGEWVEAFAGETLRRRKALVAEIETMSTSMLAAGAAQDGPDVLARGVKRDSAPGSHSPRRPQAAEVLGEIREPLSLEETAMLVNEEPAPASGKSIPSGVTGMRWHSDAPPPRRMRAGYLAITGMVLTGAAVAILGSPRATSTLSSPAAIQVSATVTATVTATATATASPSATPTPPPTATPTPARGPRLSPASRECAVPYTVDAKRIRHPKPECM